MGLVGVLLSLLIVIGVGTILLRKPSEKDVYDGRSTIVLTIDDTSLYLNELMYHVTLSKMQGQLYASFMNDKEYMQRDYGDGRTIGEVMKQEAMDNAIRYELLYKQARIEGYELEAEEITSSKEKASNILLTIPKEEQEKMQLSEEELVQIQEKIALATRYYQENYQTKDLTEEKIDEQIKEGHRITIQKKVWNSVSF